MQTKKYRSTVAYIALTIVCILLLVLYVETNERGLGVGGFIGALLFVPPVGAFILHAASAVILGVVIVVRARLCVSFPTKSLKIALPLIFAAISVGVSFLLFSHYIGSYPQLWTLAAADSACVFIGLTKKQ